MKKKTIFCELPHMVQLVMKNKNPLVDIKSCQRVYVTTDRKVVNEGRLITAVSYAEDRVTFLRTTTIAYYWVVEPVITVVDRWLGRPQLNPCSHKETRVENEGTSTRLSWFSKPIDKFKELEPSFEITEWVSPPFMEVYDSLTEKDRWHVYLNASESQQEFTDTVTGAKFNINIKNCLNGHSVVNPQTGPWTYEEAFDIMGAMWKIMGARDVERHEANRLSERDKLTTFYATKLTTPPVS